MMPKSTVTVFLATVLFAFAMLITGPVSAANPVLAEKPAAQTAWEPAEADVLKVKMLSYLHFRARGGSEVEFTRMTWYQNPPDAELPGIFVAVDYSTGFAKTGIRCGTLMWHRLDDGGFELLREQDKTIDKPAQGKTKSQSGCTQP